MKDLQNKIEKMIAGEKKRREVALKWIKEVEETLLPVAETLWGGGSWFFDAPSHAKWIDDTGTLYYRYQTWETQCQDEDPGFYFFETEMGNGPLWGDPLEDLKGPDFWSNIQKIIDFLEKTAEIIDKKEASREAILAKLS